MNRLTRWQYILLNLVNNNYFPNNIDSKLTVRNFSCDFTDEEWATLLTGIMNILMALGF